MNRIISRFPDETVKIPSPTGEVFQRKLPRTLTSEIADIGKITTTIPRSGLTFISFIRKEIKIKILKIL